KCESTIRGCRSITANWLRPRSWARWPTDASGFDSSDLADAVFGDAAYRFVFSYCDPGRLCLNVSSPFSKVMPRSLQDVICPIRARRRRSSCHGHAGSSARADKDAPVVNLFPDRRCLDMDIEAMEPGQGQVGRGKGKMGRLREAIQGSESDWPKELVIRCVLHDACISIVQDRRCLPMDIEAMESREGEVGKTDREMGRLPEAVEGSKFDRPKEL